MTQEASVPPDFWERVRNEARKVVNEYARSGSSRNMSVNGGTGMEVGAGSKFIVRHPDGKTLMLAGIYDVNDSLNLDDGSFQPVFMLRRQDGSLALSMFDQFPSINGYDQFLAWWDRNGHIIISDDTESGQGLARPYLPGVGYPAQARHWPTTTSGTFEALYRVRHNFQHPRLYVQAWGSCDTAGTTGEIAIFIDGTQFGSTQTVSSSAVAEFAFGPDNVPGGTFGKVLNVELQARRTAGTGLVQTCFSLVEGRQT